MYAFKVLLVISIYCSFTEALQGSDPFTGRYRLYNTSESYDAFLEKMGINAFGRFMAKQITQDYLIKKSPKVANSYTVSMITAFTDTTYTFKDGIEFNYTRADGVRVLSTIKIRGNQWITHEVGVDDRRVIDAVSDFKPKEIVTKMKLENVEATSKYKRITNTGSSNKSKTNSN